MDQIAEIYPKIIKERPLLGLFFKNILASAVFLVSALGILILSGILIYYGSDFNEKSQIFNIVVPVFSTWVGTILAYYFAKENFEAANKSVRDLVTKLTPEQQLQQTTVASRMRATKLISSIKLDNDGEKKVTINDIMELIKGGATRIPVFETNGSVKYIIHESIVSRYILDSIQSSTAKSIEQIKKENLSNLLDAKIKDKGAEQTLKTIALRFAIVSMDANLADARTAMLAIGGAQDVFVTKSGKAAELVEGWLTNTEITRDINIG